MIRAVMFVGSSASSMLQLLVREQRREVLEAATVARLLGVLAVDRVDAQQRRVLLVAAGRAAGALDVVAPAQAELADLLHRRRRRRPWTAGTPCTRRNP